jgi:hypothetical protein
MLSIIAYVPLAFDALVVELEHIADVVGYFSARRAEHDLVMFRSSAMGLGTARFLKVWSGGLSEEEKMNKVWIGILAYLVPSAISVQHLSALKGRNDHLRLVEGRVRHDDNCWKHPTEWLAKCRNEVQVPLCYAGGRRDSMKRLVMDLQRMYSLLDTWGSHKAQRYQRRRTGSGEYHGSNMLAYAWQLAEE